MYGEVLWVIILITASFLLKNRAIVLKFDDGEAAKGTYSIKGDSLLTIEIEDSKMVFKRLPKKPEL